MSATSFAEYIDAANQTSKDKHLGMLVFSTVRSVPNTIHIDGAHVTLPTHAGVTPEQLKQAFFTAGLDERHLRPEPLAANAFRNATGTRTTLSYAHPTGEATLEFVSVSKKGAEKETRHLIRTVVDRERGRAKVTECVAEVVFYQRGSNLPDIGGHSIKTNVLDDTLNDEERRIVREFLDLVRTRYRELLAFYTPEALRWTVRDQINALNAIRVGGPNSSCYFVHQNRANQLDQLRQVVDTLFARGSSLHLVPLVDNAYQRERLTEAFGEQIESEAEAIIAKVAAASRKANEKGGLSDTEYRKLRAEFNDAAARAEEHVRLLDKAQNVGGAALEMVLDKLNDLALQVV